MSDLESLKRVLMATKDKAKAMKKSKMEARLRPPAPPMMEAEEAVAEEAPSGEMAVDPLAEGEVVPEVTPEEALAEIKELIARAGA